MAGCFLTKPLSRNVHPDYHQGRRAARAKVQNERCGNRDEAYFVDAAHPMGGITTIARDARIQLLQKKPPPPSQRRTPLQNLYSKMAYRKYERGRISTPAHAILGQARTQATRKQFIWVPGHQGVAGNELAHNSARAFLPRALHTNPIDRGIQLPTPNKLSIIPLRDLLKRMRLVCVGSKPCRTHPK
ncbi:hypothetical protein HPB50_015169 [Hyalomma asiaticum]|uniref:Uncharacterized protein n=1 Tax=Hyalomma asiaticum TaxID=266040 RepID=A0ACB7RNT7_HYAAI|nr:hypothetical protein HPB50_015169 [Hyalomma asiaticum]